MCKKCKVNPVALGYWQNYSSYCNECNLKTTKVRVALKKKNQRKFVIRFNREVFY